MTIGFQSIAPGKPHLIVFFSITVYFRDSLIYKPTPPEARGVGAYSKIYPGMFG